MEKKEKAPRRKIDLIAPEGGEPGLDLKTATGEDIALDRLSEVADSVRKNIMVAGESGKEAQISAQAELLRSRNKVEEVRKRIQSGYYGQPDVIGRIIDKLADDLRP